MKNITYTFILICMLSFSFVKVLALSEKNNKEDKNTLKNYNLYDKYKNIYPSNFFSNNESPGLYTEEIKTIAKLQNELQQMGYNLNPIEEFSSRKAYWSGEGFVSVLKTLPSRSKIQGWKLHVSSRANFLSMLKIFQIIVPILEQENINFKYAPLKLMLKLKNDPTQRGKFITIYPQSSEQAQTIAEAIDKTLNKALEENQISPDDFDNIRYDAKLGRTGGLFTRYGLFFQYGINNNIASPNFRDDHEYFLSVNQWKRSPISETDNRHTPWPNFLNSPDAPPPFPDLPIFWEYESEKSKIILSWTEMRGRNWSDFIEN